MLMLMAKWQLALISSAISGLRCFFGRIQHRYCSAQFQNLASYSEIAEAQHFQAMPASFGHSDRSYQQRNLEPLAQPLRKQVAVPGVDDVFDFLVEQVTIDDKENHWSDSKGATAALQ